jgi:prolyl-tRNA synthetase
VPINKIKSERYISKDRKTLCTIYYPANSGGPNVYAVKAVFPNIDSSLSGEQAMSEHEGDHHISIKDPRFSLATFTDPDSDIVATVKAADIPRQNDKTILLTSAQEGDPCPSCTEGALSMHRAVEIGHTFHLGQRYSEPLEARIQNRTNQSVPVEMGCHGIGVSRIIGAVASILRDSKGLNWPLRIAPFEVVLVPGASASPAEVTTLYERLSKPPLKSGKGLDVVRSKSPGFDVVIDDRDKPMGWKLNDADMVGYPFIIVMGNQWRKNGMVELQCRRAGVKEMVKVEISVNELVERMRGLAERL